MDHSEVKHLPKVDHTPAELDEPAKLLLKAADLIERQGWIQHECQNEGGYCVQGAIKAVSPVYDWFGTAAHAGYKRLRAAVDQGGGVIGWNDQRERTQAEVVSKMRAVALGL